MIDHILRAFRTGFLWLAAGLLLSGCDTNKLEYDRMTGTAFPQAQTVSGSTVTLTSIFAEAGFLLEVREDQTAIAPLGKDSITEAELDALESAYRSSPVEPDRWTCGWWIFRFTCHRYYLWGVVVNHYYQKDNYSEIEPNTMGRMWTFDKRRAFANFYKNATVNGNPGKYLRSTAHEIGHAFNLVHEDGEDDPRSLMNTTGNAGPNYTYTFSPNSQDHLKNHPTDCVRPGAGFYDPVIPICHTHRPYAAVPNPVCK